MDNMERRTQRQIRRFNIMICLEKVVVLKMEEKQIQNLVWKYSQQYLLIGSWGGADGVRKKEKSTVSLNSKFWAQTSRSAS